MIRLEAVETLPNTGQVRNLRPQRLVSQTKGPGQREELGWWLVS